MYLFENRQPPSWHLVNSEDNLIALQLSQPWEKPIACLVAFEVESEAQVIQILLCLVFRSLHLAKCLVFVEFKSLQRGLLECVAFPIQSIDPIVFCCSGLENTRILDPKCNCAFSCFHYMFCKSHICLSYQCTAANVYSKKIKTKAKPAKCSLPNHNSLTPTQIFNLYRTKMAHKPEY